MWLISVLLVSITACTSVKKSEPSSAGETPLLGNEKGEKASCDNPPVVMCCQAMIESCLSCQERAKIQAEEWDRRCLGKRKVTPVPTSPQQP